MSKLHLLFTATVLLLSLAGAARGADAKVDGEGFIRDWLMLAPFSVQEDSGAEEIEKKQIDKEGELHPKAGDKQKIGDKEETWKAVSAKEYDLNFNEVLAKQNEDVVGYLVTYVVSDKDVADVTLGIGSNDQAKLWLNGKEVYKFTETRTIDKDTDKVKGQALVKGVNLVVFKVINQKNDWAAALRFLDKDGKPLTDLTVKLAP